MSLTFGQLQPLNKEGSLSCHTLLQGGLDLNFLIRRTAKLSSLKQQAGNTDWGTTFSNPDPRGMITVENQCKQHIAKSKNKHKDRHKNEMSTGKETYWGEH